MIDALDGYVTENFHTVTCADATGVDNTKLTSVTRDPSGTGCVFTVDPIDALAQSEQGDTTFSVEFSSAGGGTVTGTFTVNIGPDSNIRFVQPEFFLGRNRTLTINALEHITEDSSYTVSCADPTAIDTLRLTSVTRNAGGNGCTFIVDPIDNLSEVNHGEATFSVVFSSTGGSTLQGQFRITIGSDSIITFTAPTNLKVGRNRTLTINALDYATESEVGYIIECSSATDIDISLSLIHI